jgi:Mlc titration factor MtfA (ptsG expression regulator)
MAPFIVLFAIFLLILIVVFYKKQKKKITFPSNYRTLLQQHVAFYRSLSPKNKTRFEEKISDFFNYVRIEGVNTEVNDLDKLLVGSSAIIPIFGFDKWTYYNLNNVLLYPNTFNKDEFLAGGYEKNTLGMVGNGPMQRMMILSKQALHAGFENEADKENTGIHEFVHLLDKEDGDVDGLPEVLLNKKYNVQWLELVNDSIHQIMEGRSDINSYGASNKAEFFAVASEYFFNNPTLFKTHHPALYELMAKMFNQRPGEN